MKLLILASCMFIATIGHAQTDSLEVKLQQYKTLFEKGLITSAEYEALRGRELKLNTGAVVNVQPEPPKQKGENVNILVGPVIFQDLAHSVQDLNHKYAYPSGLKTGVGINVQVGANIKRRYFPNVSLGLEGSKARISVPLGIAFNMNILPGKVSPYFHVGFGYMYQRYAYANNQSQVFNGLFTGAGFGLNVYLAKKVSLVISPDYRFVFYVDPVEMSNGQSPEGGGLTYNRRHILHQIGGRIQVMFL